MGNPARWFLPLLGGDVDGYGPARQVLPTLKAPNLPSTHLHPFDPLEDGALP
jgi:hypothetical protein